MENHIKDDRLSCALNNFVDEMDSRLAEKEAEGKKFWDDPRWYVYILQKMDDDFFALKHEEDREDCNPKMLLVDIANRCMMLWYQLNNNSTDESEVERQ